MAASELIAVGNTAANSADFTVVAGSPVTVALKGADAMAVAYIELKDDAGAYEMRGQLSQLGGESVIVIDGPGVWRVRRPAGKTCGVFRG